MGRLPFPTKIITAVRNGRLQLLLREFERKGAEMFFFFFLGAGRGWESVFRLF